MSVVASLPYLLRLARRGAIPLTVLLLAEELLLAKGWWKLRAVASR